MLCTDFAKGRRHDFILFKDSRIYLKKESTCVVDTAYQGIQKIHTNSQLPKKKVKKTLTKEDKKQNQRISAMRITIENIIREVKIFKIIAEKYRSRRRRFTLRFNLIAAMCNLKSEEVHYQNIVSLPLSDQTEMGSGADQPNRDNLTEWNENGEQNISHSYLSIPIENAAENALPQ